MHNPDSPEFYTADFETQILEFINQHRDMLLHLLDGLSEDEARHQLVPSKITLLGLIKHAIFVEQVWFQEASTGDDRQKLGIPETPDGSFDLSVEDTIESVMIDYRKAIEISDLITQKFSVTDTFTGNRRGDLPIRWVYLHLLRELAQHCGHGDILREQILALRTA